MANWLTTHFAHPKPDDHAWHIYLQEKFAEPGAVGSIIRSGDGVLFYELASNPLKGPRCPRGRQGIVVAAKVHGGIRERDPSAAIGEKVNGDAVNYKWEIFTTSEERKGYVCKRCVLRILEFKPKYTFIGFGGGSGIKALCDDQYRELLNLFHGGCGHPIPGGRSR